MVYDSPGFILCPNLRSTSALPPSRSFASTQEISAQGPSIRRTTTKICIYAHTLATNWKGWACSEEQS